MDPPGLEAREESSSEAEGEDNTDTSISLDERLLQIKNNLQRTKLELKRLQRSRDRMCKKPIGTLIDQPIKSTLTSAEQNSRGYIEHIYILQELLTPDDQERIEEEGESAKIQGDFEELIVNLKTLSRRKDVYTSILKVSSAGQTLLRKKNLADPTNMGLRAKLRDHYTTALIGMGTIDASGLEDIISTAKHTVDEVKPSMAKTGEATPLTRNLFATLIQLSLIRLLQLSLLRDHDSSLIYLHLIVICSVGETSGHSSVPS